MRIKMFALKIMVIIFPSTGSGRYNYLLDLKSHFKQLKIKCTHKKKILNVTFATKDARKTQTSIEITSKTFIYRGCTNSLTCKPKGINQNIISQWTNYRTKRQRKLQYCADSCNHKAI